MSNDHRNPAGFDVKNTRLPRVTGVIGVIDKGPGLLRWVANQGWANAQRILKDSGERGTAIHAWIHGAATQQRVVLGADSEDVGPKRAFLALRRRVLPRYRVLASHLELSVACGVCGFRGTLDAFFHLRHRRRGVDRYVLADWKTSNAHRQEYPLQTAAYVHALVGSGLLGDAIGGSQIERWCFRFASDGTLDSRRHFRYDADLGAFQHALGIYKWKSAQR
jgi:hypothetical protein